MIVAPPSKRVVYNSDVDKSVWVHCPTAGAFFWAQRGGLWDGRPRGFLEEQVRRQVESGIAEHAARAWVDAMQFGGKTEAETWALIRDRNCHNPTGFAHELMELADLPDRWFRNAWTRSHNGGPVYVSLEKARPIQWTKVRNAAKLERERRSQQLAEWRKPLRIVWHSIERAIRNARDADELRRVWPENLPLPN
jgi:hypothetical protein